MSGTVSDSDAAPDVGGGLRWLWLSFAVLAADQATKLLAEAALTRHTPVPITPFLNLTLTYNPGAAFSFLGDAGGWQRWLFIGLALAVSVLLVVWLRGLERGNRWLGAALSLVLGGAVGNLIDRVTRGEVVDFVDFHIRAWTLHWPAFNVADSAICIGAVMLVVDAFRGSRPEPGG